MEFPFNNIAQPHVLYPINELKRHYLSFVTQTQYGGHVRKKTSSPINLMRVADLYVKVNVFHLFVVRGVYGCKSHLCHS